MIYTTDQKKLPKIIISSNTAWSIVNFRKSLIRTLINYGYDVLAIAPSDEYSSMIGSLGARYCSLPMDNKGTNPLRDFFLFCRFLVIFVREKPCAFLGFTVKPNVYGSLASRLIGIPTINNVAGLGSVFIRKNWITRVVEILYRVGLAGSYKIFFQNNEDQELFISRGLVHRQVTDVLPGSGVDTERFKPSVYPERDFHPFRFLLSARLLWDKGVGEYVEAARSILAKRQDVEFQILGFLDVQNPTAIPKYQIETWQSEGIIHYLGSANDVRPFLSQADCVVLPSYREGTPRSLLEASSMEKPIITTDSVGCRDVVEDGVTGFLCRPRDAIDLADKMKKMLSLSVETRREMGRAGRRKMIAQYDEHIVINKYLDILNKLKLEKKNV